MVDWWLRHEEHASEWGPLIHHRLGPGPLERPIANDQALPRTGVVGVQFLAQRGDFGLECFVLGLLARQEVGGEAQLVGDPLRGQDMQIAELIGVLREVAPLHEALLF
jgi:hypothetical protein